MSIRAAAVGIVLLYGLCWFTPKEDPKAKEYIVWMTLPSTNRFDSAKCFTDSGVGAPTQDIEWLRIRGRRFCDDDTFLTSVNVVGKEGDSLGIGFEFPDNDYTCRMGVFEFSVADTAGNESCRHSFTFAVGP